MSNTIDVRTYSEYKHDQSELATHWEANIQRTCKGTGCTQLGVLKIPGHDPLEGRRSRATREGATDGEGMYVGCQYRC